MFIGLKWINSIYYHKGQYDQALQYHNKAFQIRLEKLGSDHPDVAILYSNIGNVYDSKGQYDQALEYHNKASKIRLEKLGSDHP